MKENTGKSHYNSDIYKWAITQAHLLKKEEFSKIDLKHIVEEIEDLGISQRNALESQIIRLLMHMLKVQFQPEKHTKSWDKSIGNARISIDRILDKNPSLKKELPSMIQDSYHYARRKASVETRLDIRKFPENCPWSLEKILKDS